MAARSTTADVRFARATVTQDQRRRLARRVALSTSLLLALLAALVICILHERADRSRRAQVLLAGIVQQGYEQASIESRAMQESALFGQTLAANVARRLDLLRAGIDNSLDELATLDPGGQEVQRRLRDAFAAYGAALVEERQWLIVGEPEKAFAFNTRRTKPTFESVQTEAAEASTTYNRRAQRENLESNLGSVFASLIAAAAVGLLFWRLERSRRAADLVAAEQRALQSSEEWFRLLAQNSSDILLVLDFDGTIFYCSPSITHVMGGTAEERIGKNIFRFSAVHPQDQEKREAFFQKVLNTPGADVATELRLCHPDGAPRHFEVIGKNLLKDPSVAGIVVNYRHITERKLAEEASRTAHQKLSFHVENSPVGVVEWDREMRILDWSREAETIFGWRCEEVVGKRIGADVRLIHEEDEEAVGDVLTALLLGGERRVVFQNRNYTKDGSVVHCEWYNSALLDESGKLVSVMSIALDVTERKRADENIRQLGRYNRSLIEANLDGLMMLSPAGEITDANPAMEGMTGLSRERLVGTEATQYFTDREAAAEAIRLGFHHGSVRSRPLEILHRDGRTTPVVYNASVYRDATGDIIGLLGAARDITERKALEDRLAHQAFHDALTGLPNRALFMDRVEHALARAARQGGLVAVLYLDLDGFKHVNDSLGHERGDELLVAVAGRLGATLRDEDTFARLGGDEFTVLLEEVAEASYAIRVAERIITALQAPFTLQGREVFVGTSVGIVLGAPDSSSPVSLLRDADMAMYRAKQAGKGRCEVFDKTMNELASRRLDLESELRRALDREEFVLHYQPIVDLIHHEGATGRLVGMEALVRWNHPTQGLVSPCDFIPLAEETGLILPLGRWVLWEACRQARRWGMESGPGPAPFVSVNLSSRQFGNPDLVGEVAEALRLTGVDPHSISLEITESAVMEDGSATISTLQQLKELGVTLAIDDFGMGYSSLSYLKRFPVDTLKIDKSFVSGLGHDLEDTAIVQAVITLAKTLGMHVIAEGAETPEQLSRLRALGCELGQGYYFSKPMPSDSASQALAKGSYQLSAIGLRA